MSAAEVLAELRAAGAELTPVAGGIRFRASRPVPAELLARARALRPALLALLVPDHDQADDGAELAGAVLALEGPAGELPPDHTPRPPAALAPFRWSDRVPLPVVAPPPAGPLPHPLDPRPAVAAPSPPAPLEAARLLAPPLPIGASGPPGETAAERAARVGCHVHPTGEWVDASKAHLPPARPFLPRFDLRWRPSPFDPEEEHRQKLRRAVVAECARVLGPGPAPSGGGRAGSESRNSLPMPPSPPAPPRGREQDGADGRTEPPSCQPSEPHPGHDGKAGKASREGDDGAGDLLAPLAPPLGPLLAAARPDLEARRVELLAALRRWERIERRVRRRFNLARELEPVPWAVRRPWPRDEPLSRCGALCRGGHPCRAPVYWRPDREEPGSRCRLHGGMSTGPQTPEGRAAIADSNRRRAAAKRSK